MRCAVVAALLLVGCAADEPEEAAPAEQDEEPETDEEREERHEATTAAVCDEFRSFEAEMNEGPTDQRIEERLSQIRSLGNLATNDMREAVRQMDDVGTRAELDEWLEQMDAVCTEHGH